MIQVKRGGTLINADALREGNELIRRECPLMYALGQGKLKLVRDDKGLHMVRIKDKEKPRP